MQINLRRLVIERRRWLFWFLTSRSDRRAASGWSARLSAAYQYNLARPAALRGPFDTNGRCGAGTIDVVDQQAYTMVLRLRIKANRVPAAPSLPARQPRAGWVGLRAC